MWGKCVFFNKKTGHISETVRYTAKVTMNHYYEVTCTLSD